MRSQPVDPGTELPLRSGLLSFIFITHFSAWPGGRAGFRVQARIRTIAEIQTGVHGNANAGIDRRTSLAAVR